MLSQNAYTQGPSNSPLTLAQDADPKDGITWSPTPPPLSAATNTDPGGKIRGYGIQILSSSTEVVPDRQFTTPLLQALEQIYNYRPNRSEIVKHYSSTGNNETGLRMEAVQEGLDAKLPIAFNNHALVLFTRWLGQTLPAREWITFACLYGYDVGVGRPRVLAVAVGNYTAYRT
ncbi:MAG: hypothetical protein Q9168_006944 [Polycauliona sp. 1 TL-2023]